MKKFKFIIIIGLLILSFLIYKIGFLKIINVLKNFNVLFLPLILIIFLIPHILAGLNLWILAKPYKNISLLKLIKYSFFTLFYGTFIPGKIADLFMIFYLKRDNLNISKSTIIILFDKSISLILKSLLGIIGAIFILKKLNFLVIGIPILMILIILSLFLLISHKRFRDFIKKVILKKYSKIFKGFSKNLKEYTKNNKKELFYNLIITSIKIIFETTLLFLLFLSLGQNTNFISVLLIFSLLSVMNLILSPISISGLGIREALGIIMYSTINIDPAIIFSSYMIKLLIIYLINLLTFIFYAPELNLIKKYKFFNKTN